VNISITKPKIEHLAILPEIELAAAQMFTLEDLPEPLRSSPTKESEFLKARANGLLWVALDQEDLPRGFLLSQLVDDSLHIKEMDVHPDSARQGIGRKLLEHVFVEAAERGFSRITLTTFRHLPWNAIFYKKMGFHVIPSLDIEKDLAQIMSRENNAGLKNRVAMYKKLA